MNNKLIISFILFFGHSSIIGQINSDTIYYKETKILVYTYLLYKDTVVKAYFDKNIPRVIKKRKTNIGKVKFDLTLDSIYKFVRLKYPSASLTGTDIQYVELETFNKNFKPKSASAISTDFYWISAINYYIEELEKDSNSWENHYELAITLNECYPTYSLKHDTAISHLNSCNLLKPDFEEAYLLKAKLLEKNGIIKGSMMSEPHHVIVDISEIRLAIKSLDELLLINPNNSEAKKYKEELKNKYKKYKNL